MTEPFRWRLWHGEGAMVDTPDEMREKIRLFRDGVRQWAMYIENIFLAYDETIVDREKRFDDWTWLKLQDLQGTAEYAWECAEDGFLPIEERIRERELNERLDFITKTYGNDTECSSDVEAAGPSDPVGEEQARIGARGYESTHRTEALVIGRPGIEEISGDTGCNTPVSNPGNDGVLDAGVGT